MGINEKIPALLVILMAPLSSYASGPASYSHTDNSIFPPATVSGALLSGSEFNNTFSGRMDIGRSCLGIPLRMTCALVMEAKFSQDASYANLDLQFSNAAAYTLHTPSTLLSCSAITFPAVPWTASIPHSSLPSSATDTTPVSFFLNGVQVSTPCGTCSGTLNASYTNGNNGEFSIIGSIGACSVQVDRIRQVLGGEYSIWH